MARPDDKRRDAVVEALRRGEQTAVILERFDLTRGQLAGIRNRAGLNVPRTKPPAAPAVARPSTVPAPASTDRRPPSTAAAPASTVEAVLALGPHDCRWPIGDPQRPGFRFCGAARREGSSYCRRHAREALADVQPGRAR